MDSRRLVDAPSPARRRQAQPSLPLPVDDPARSARDLLLHSWPGRLFVVATAFKIIVGIVRLFVELPRVPAGPQHGRLDRPGVLGALLHHAPRVPRAAAPPVARAPKADPLLHLHRRRSIAAHLRVLPARRLSRHGHGRRIRLQKRVRRSATERAAACRGRCARGGTIAAHGGGDRRARAAQRFDVAPLSGALDRVHSGAPRRSAARQERTLGAPEGRQRTRAERAGVDSIEGRWLRGTGVGQARGRAGRARPRDSRAAASRPRAFERRLGHRRSPDRRHDDRIACTTRPA